MWHLAGVNSHLTFEYEFSRDDDFGWLIARLETPDISGCNGMWVQWQDLDDYAAALARHPIPQGDAITRDWGFGERGSYTEVTKIMIAPAGATAALLADVSLTNYYDPRIRCRALFETDYRALSEFREQIGHMMRSRSGSATLTGSAPPILR